MLGCWPVALPSTEQIVHLTSSWKAQYGESKPLSKIQGKD